MNSERFIGPKLKELRVAKGMIQKQVANALNLDVAYVSKIEHNEKPVNRDHLKTLSSLFDIPENDLQTLWLTDKILQLIENEKFSVQALEMALNKVKEK